MTLDRWIGGPAGRGGGTSGRAWMSGGRGTDLALGALAVLGALVTLAVWATGELAGRLAGGRWPGVGLSELPSILVRLPAHAGDPRLAWPAPLRPLLPGAAAMYALGGMVAAGLALAGVVGCAGWRWGRGLALGGGGARRRLTPRGRRWGGGLAGGGGGARRQLTPRRRRQLGPRGAPAWSAGRSRGARWATRRDLRPVVIGRPIPGRLVLGRAGRALVATESSHSVLVLGPTQSGKTTGLAIPAILEWEGPVVATSVKGDLAGATASWRSRQGRCWVFDPTATAGAGAPAPWSPLSEAGTWGGAQRMASWLVEATPAKGGLSDSAFWYSAAAKLLAPLLLAAQGGGGTMADVVRWNNQGDLDEPAHLLGSAGEAEAGRALFACDERDDRIRSSVSTTLETVLAPFEDPVVVASTSASAIDPRSLVTRGGTLYLCGPSYEQSRLQGLFAALVSSVVAAAVEAASRIGGRLDPPLLLVLDEAANIAPLRDLDTLASTGAGLGIQLVTICQDLSQLTSRYGDDRARSIANNHRAKLVLSGVSDLATLDLVSGLAGEAAVQEETRTADLRDGRRTRSQAVAYRRLVPADELRRTPPGTGVLVYGHLPAARLHLRPWFGERQLAAKVAAAKT
ncbi:MAG: type IV secretory system conjugative DNA transfer family protein [Acidimicrobiales bacterium]